MRKTATRIQSEFDSHMIIMTEVGVQFMEIMKDYMERQDYDGFDVAVEIDNCLLYTSPSPRDGLLSRMPSSA